MITFKCPVCGAAWKAPDRAAGRKATCERCLQRLLVPAPQPRPPTAPGERVNGSPSAIVTCSACGARLRSPSGSEGKNLRCPLCQALIVASVAWPGGRSLASRARTPPSPAPSQAARSARPQKALSVRLRVWHPESKRVPASDFLNECPIAPGDAALTANGAGVPGLELLTLSTQEFSAAEQTSEALTTALRDGLVRAARRLERKSPSVFRELRKAGLVTEVVIDMRIDLDQTDLDLPSAFLKVCSRLGLTVSLIVKDRATYRTSASPGWQPRHCLCD